MTVFADASALIAIIVNEPDAADLANRLETERRRLCSALSVWETIAGLRFAYTFPSDSARAHVRRFLSAADFQFVGIGEPEFEIATDAYVMFGKGRHPAALNMGDCFAYACAKTNRAKLLFKGDDFNRTDIDIL